MDEKHQPDVKPPKDDRAHDESPLAEARRKGKLVPDGEAIGELGDEVGGPA
jgi:hypothetical protein